jgi:hypothetical protein
MMLTEDGLDVARRLLTLSLRVEFGSDDIYVHYGKVPRGLMVDPVPINELIDICISKEQMHPLMIENVYEACRSSLNEFKWGEQHEHN